MSVHVFPIPNLPPTSLPIPSLWVISVYQPWAPCIMPQTWAGNSFHMWYFTCFNAILPNHPTFALSHRVQKTVLYICVSFAVSHTGLSFSSVQFSSVAQSCPTLCDPMNRNTPGLPVHHQLLEFTQTHIHWVSDAFQPSHPLSSPSPLAPNPSQHQSLFQGVNSSHEVAKVLEFQL